MFGHFLPLLLLLPLLHRHDAALDDGEGEGLPYGPVGTTWAVINAQWWAHWRDYARIGFDATMVRERTVGGRRGAREGAT